ncbi:hypothetical protein GGQ24_01820 [Nocardioides sp. zg-578]|nr:hypothetical protein [Nocardioides marmotae]
MTKAVVMEAYLHGISTRSVDDLVEGVCTQVVGKPRPPL